MASGGGRSGQSQYLQVDCDVPKGLIQVVRSRTTALNWPNGLALLLLENAGTTREFNHRVPGLRARRRLNPQCQVGSEMPCQPLWNAEAQRTVPPSIGLWRGDSVPFDCGNLGLSWVFSDSPNRHSRKCDSLGSAKSVSRSAHGESGCGCRGLSITPIPGRLRPCLRG